MEITESKKGKINYITVALLSVVFLLFASFTTGIRSDHIFLLGIVNICYVISPFTRRLITGLTIIIVYWIIFDSMKAWPNYAFHKVDIVPLYNLEKTLFGIHRNGFVITPNEYFLNHTNTFLDIITGIFYLSWVPLPLIFSLFLFWKNKNLFLRFSMAFFVVNIIGFIIYYTHPAAPPWYYAIHGGELITDTKSNAAGLLRFDQYFGIHLFEGIYSKGSNVFAAMPSMHASFPLLGLIYAYKVPSRFFKITFAIFMFGIWFSAIYLSHHYILDLLAGISCGITAVLILEKVLLKNKRFNNFILKYENAITKN
jgi:hypothetical protein